MPTHRRSSPSLRPLQWGRPRGRRRGRGGAGEGAQEALAGKVEAAHWHGARMRRRRVHRAERALAQVVPWGLGSGDPAPRAQVQEADQPGSLLHHGERSGFSVLCLFLGWFYLLFPSSTFVDLIRHPGSSLIHRSKMGFSFPKKNGLQLLPLLVTSTYLLNLIYYSVSA